MGVILLPLGALVIGLYVWGAVKGTAGRERFTTELSPKEICFARSASETNANTPAFCSNRIIARAAVVH